MSWEPMIRAALLGTGRGGRLHLEPDPPVARLLAGIDPADGAHALLIAAGTQDLYEAVGRLPGRRTGDDVWQAAPPDPLPDCPAAAQPFLERLLSGTHRANLPEFLAQMQGGGCRVPDILLPNSLIYGARFVREQDVITPILGSRGRWLAAFHPKWQYAAIDAADWDDLIRRWQKQNLKEQAMLLEQVRRQNPQTGRDLLETSWRREPDNSRIHLIRLMSNGLEPADEPFLERALDDRHARVRQQAADLLANLPQSRLVARLQGYLNGFVHWSPLHKQKITVTFPPELTPEMIRSGLQPRKSQALPNYISKQLLFMVGAVPLSYWTDRWNQKPERIIAAVLDSGWARTMTAGLSRAATQQQNSHWARLLLEMDGFTIRTQRLISVLPAEEAEGLIHAAMDEWENEPLNQKNRLRVLWREWAGVWSAELSLRWIELMARYIAQDTESKAPDVSLRSIFLKFAGKCPPDLVDEMETRLRPALASGSVWQMVVDEAVDRLRFRSGMLQALQEAGEQEKTGSPSKS